MNREPSSTLIMTFVVALGLKMVGALTAVILSYRLIGESVLNRWSVAFITSLIPIGLLIWLWQTKRSALFPLALVLGIIGPSIDMIAAGAVPFARLMQNAPFVALGWTEMQVADIHALGQLFMMVPVVLASWHYGVKGFLSSMILAGCVYLLTPFFLPETTFIWGNYLVRGFVLLGVTFILAFAVGTLASTQRRTFRELADANQQLTQQAATLEQLATSRERNRLARELHDTLAHSLSGTAVSLQAITTLLKHDPAAAETALVAAQTQVKDGLTESRRAIAALRATPLEDLGLAEALRQHCHNLSQRMGVPISCDVTVDSLTVFVEQTIFRVADEALANAEKYAQASRIAVFVQETADNIQLTVHDNGVGFDVENVQEKGRFGLLGMQERANLVNGQLNIDSKLNEGTTIKLIINSQ